MIALDTNVIVRVVTRDDEQQLRAAVKVLKTSRLWISKTVVLETEWVLRHCYDLSREIIHHTLQTLLGYRRVEVEDREAVLQALAWHARGMELADALHLASSRHASRFATFDRRFWQSAKKIDAAPQVDLLR